MFFKDTVESHVLKFLGTTPYSSAKEIHHALSNRYSIQAIYKVLKKLQAESIIVKAQKEYALSYSWIELQKEFLNNCESAFETVVDLNAFTKNQTKKQTWRFSNLITLKHFWSHLVMLLLKNSDSNISLSFNPHAWFYFIQSDHQDKLMKGMQKNNAFMYKIVGSRHPLDLIAKEFWSSKHVSCSFSKEPYPDEKLYFSVIDNYIINVKISRKGAETLEQLYKTYKKNPNLALPYFLKFFSSNSKGSISLSYNPKIAAKHRRKFDIFFGFNREHKKKLEKLLDS